MGGLVGSPVPLALTSCNLVSMCPVAGGGKEQEAAGQTKAAPWG